MKKMKQLLISFVFLLSPLHSLEFTEGPGYWAFCQRDYTVIHDGHLYSSPKISHWRYCDCQGSKKLPLEVYGYCWKDRDDHTFYIFSFDHVWAIENPQHSVFCPCAITEVYNATQERIGSKNDLTKHQGDESVWPPAKTSSRCGSESSRKVER